MLRILGEDSHLCDGVTRRDWLRVGGLSLGGLTLPSLHALRNTASAEDVSLPVKAKSVILFFLLGGVPQHDTWDPKPDGPEGARSEFGAISTTIPGVHVGGLMPRTAALMQHVAVLRAMSTGDHAHSSSGYQMLTGIPHAPIGVENALPGAPNDWPSLGAITRMLRSDRDGLPSAITLPRHIANTGEITWPGQDAGILGRRYDPWLLNCDPSNENFRLPELQLGGDVSPLRFNRRRSLLEQINHHLDGLERRAASNEYDLRSEQAVSLLAGQRVRDAFDLSQEPAAVRDRYGRTRFAQSVLLARRLVEAGTSLVQVNWQRLDGKENFGTWDTHLAHHESLKGWLMPIMDQSFSALIEDLEQRGLLEETLVVWLGEFGHTPRINANGGRDHWGHVFSIAMAGGGVQGGVVHGVTDAQGGYPLSGMTLACDYAATVFHCLGIPPDTIIHDRMGRPFPISRGRVINEILT